MDADPDPAAPTLRLAPGVDVDALEQALLRARATELSEVRRRQVRLSAGYGDATTRGSMDVLLMTDPSGARLPRGKQTVLVNPRSRARAGDMITSSGLMPSRW